MTTQPEVVFVTGAGGTASQNFIKSLRMAGRSLTIVGSDSNPYQLTAAAVDKAILLPSAYEPDYKPCLLRALQKFGATFLHAQPDVEVETISGFRDALPCRYFLPSHSVICTCHDKARTRDVLNSCEVPVPNSRRVDTLAKLPKLFDELQVSSGEKVWVRAVKGAGSRAALPVTSVRQAHEWIHYWRATRKLDSQEFMLCEFLPGKEFAFQSLWHKGELVTSMARERVQYLFGNLFPSGQSSSPSVARTVHNPEVNSVASAAVRAVDPAPHGIYCVDLKENSRGIPCVTEINIGRFFTTSDFFSRAGLNMPAMYLELGLGRNVESVPKFDALPAGLYWVRGVDTEPKLLREEQWCSIDRA